MVQMDWESVITKDPVDVINSHKNLTRIHNTSRRSYDSLECLVMMPVHVAYQKVIN